MKLCLYLFFNLQLVWCLTNFADTNCGRIKSLKSAKIVGGQNAQKAEFPWIVSITRRGGHYCGGSVITNRHILTAGHCVCSGIGEDLLKPSQIKVTLGQHDLTQSNSEAYERSLSNITVHPGYSCRKPKNDIAIIELTAPLEWSESVLPVCFPEVGGHQKFENSLATVAGWGWTNENSQKGGRAKILQKAKVNVLENKKCQEWYTSQGKKTKIQESQFCAGHEQGGVDSCWADSGGPLMVTSKDNVMVIGVVSTGIGCARPYLPGLYTKVSDYMPWIKSIVAK